MHAPFTTGILPDTDTGEDPLGLPIKEPINGEPESPIRSCSHCITLQASAGQSRQQVFASGSSGGNPRDPRLLRRQNQDALSYCLYYKVRPGRRGARLVPRRAPHSGPGFLYCRNLASGSRFALSPGASLAGTARRLAPRVTSCTSTRAPPASTKTAPSRRSASSHSELPRSATNT